MTYGNLAQPYPDLIAALELECKALRIDIKERDQLLERTRQQYVDADHMLRLRDDECRKLRSEVDTLRFEAKDLMAAETNYIEAIDAYKVRVAHLEHEEDQLKLDKARLYETIAGLQAENAWLKGNAERQAEVIRDLDGETQRLRKPPLWKVDATGNAELVVESDAMASLANTLAGIDNEERD